MISVDIAYIFKSRSENSGFISQWYGLLDPVKQYTLVQPTEMSKFFIWKNIKVNVKFQIYSCQQKLTKV